MTNTIFEGALAKILDIAKRFSAALDAAGIPYRVVGGMATFIHVDEVDSMASRLTRDVDVAIDRSLLDKIRAAVEPHGFIYRHAAGVDMFLPADDPKVRNGIHIVFLGEKVRPEYLEPIPGSPAERCKYGFLIASVKDLVVMKLTSFRMKDQVHIQDMDSVGLITPEIEADLSEPLRQRLAEVRSKE